MKTENEIRDDIVKLNIKRIEVSKKRRELHQIDLLSGEGNELLALENYLFGQISALYWVLTK